MKNMKTSLPVFVILCILTSGCAEMPKNMDWFAKWDAGSTETESESESETGNRPESLQEKVEQLFEELENRSEEHTSELQSH